MGRVIEEPGEVIGGGKKDDREGADGGEVGNANVKITTEEEDEATDGAEGRDGMGGGVPGVGGDDVED